MEKEGVGVTPTSEDSEGKPSSLRDESSQNSIKSEQSERSEQSEGTLEAMPSIKDILSLERLTSNIQDKCQVCGFVGPMDWQATLHDGSWGMFCGKCGDRLGKKLEEVK